MVRLFLVWPFCKFVYSNKKGRIGCGRFIKKSLHAASSGYEKEKKNLYNVLLALAFVFLWLYYRKEMWRICDRFLKRK